jgi:protein TonB
VAALGAGAFLLTRGQQPTGAAALATPVAATPEAPAPVPSTPEPTAVAPTATASPGADDATVAPTAAPRPKKPRAPKPTPTPIVVAAVPEPTPEPTPPPTVEGQLVEMGPGVTPPRKVKGPSAEYPERARRQKLEGTVGISLLVDENGVPRELTIVESAGPVLDEAVMKAVKEWRFEPAQKDGVRVKMRWLVRQTYKRAR